ncbi:hypothetical protein DRN62_02680 [Nanoarchaeota archaeon]|nr:MAG: hypothetical protein DRN62_02680 [Nanoarchaeota archaeon]
MRLQETLKTRKLIIGALHFKPLLGYEGFTNLSDILKTALKDLRAFERGGVDAVIVENNYDIPHKIFVGPETVSAMTFLTLNIVQKSRIPIGVNVLWNDYRAALSIAKVCGAEFVRIPVFVDNVRTDFGDIYGEAEEVIEFRERIKAKDVLLFTDIQVKHARMLKEKEIEESARQAIASGSDALIVTGRWTGEVPDLKKLRRVREAVGDFPILVGSGANKDNIRELLRYADGCIVSTSLKEGSRRRDERNVKPYECRIDERKVKEFVEVVRQVS